MKSFKKFVQEKDKEHFEWYSFESEGYVINILFDIREQNNITEAKHKGTPLGGTYAAQLHAPHSDVGMKHLHVYSKNNQLFSLNIDGTAHDQSHGIQIPNKVAKAIGSRFPDFQLPSNKLIESAPKAIQVLVKLKGLCG